MESTLELNIHPNILKFMELCRDINFGTIQELSIQDGIPVFVKYVIETELDGIVIVRKKLG